MWEDCEHLRHSYFHLFQGSFFFSSVCVLLQFNRSEMGCSPCTGRKVVESHGTQFTPPLDPPIVRISPESSSISVKSRDTRKAAPAPGPVITMDRVDVSSMTRVAETTTFDEEIQGPISVRNSREKSPRIVSLSFFS